MCVVSFVAIDSIFDYFERFCVSEKVSDGGLFIFKLLIYLEKMYHFIKYVSRKLGYIGYRVIVWIREGNSDDLIVVLTGVEHSHYADGINLNKRHRIYRLGADNEDVKRVVVNSKEILTKAR